MIANHRLTTRLLMAGYAARKEPSEGTEQELFAKALAIEDSVGKRAALSQSI